MSKIATPEATGYEPQRAPRGTTLSCKGWQQEAAMRMLINNLDQVAEKPEELIVYGARQGGAPMDRVLRLVQAGCTSSRPVAGRSHHFV